MRLHEQILVTAHGEHEQSADLERHEWRENGGKAGPDDEGVPFPLPQQVNELERMAMAEVKDIGLGEREALRSEEQDAGVNERQEEEPLQRCNGVNPDLRGDVVEAKHPGQHEHGAGGQAEKRVDPDEQCNGETPREPFGADAFFEQPEQGPEDPASQEVA